MDGQDSLVDKALNYRPKGNEFDPRLDHKRRPTWATNSFSMWDNKDLLIIIWSGLRKQHGKQSYTGHDQNWRGRHDFPDRTGHLGDQEEEEEVRDDGLTSSEAMVVVFSSSAHSSLRRSMATSFSKLSIWLV
jgi:hypothetical protein